ncbi:ABC transporter ATP-binding protein [Flavihumibacter sp.]|uniref:ABC transporter ATP-binding protein n=1 Tax=Flavihumibacter sp. TaxID=1913981 RepID=UPI002FC74A5D
MSNTVIRVENVSKQYQLGKIGTGSFSHDINRWLHRVRGKEDPYIKVGETNDRTTKGSSDFVWSLRDVSFDVQKGEALGIMGRNGAGKSTLLKILSRTTSPTLGKISIKGRVASLLEVGTGFHPELTGRENIFLNGAILGMTKKEILRKFDEIVDFAGVERYIDTPVKRYSSGMYVRLAFGVAAHLEPEILIVDEVLAVGDLEFQRKALGKMEQVSEGEGRTVLFVSHNLDSLARLCKKGVLLDQGKLLYSGSISEALNRYTLVKQTEEFYINNDSNPEKDVFIREITLLDKGGNRKNTFFHDEEIVVKLNLVLNRNVEEYSIFLMVLDKTKSRVFPTEHKLKSAVDTYELVINPNFLVRGSYSLHVIIHKPRKVQIDVAEDVCGFEIVDNNSPLNIHNKYDYGNVFGNCYWK